MKFKTAAVIATLALAATLTTTAHAQTKSTFVPLGGGAQGLLYEPATPGARAHVALVNMHSYSSYLGHNACSNMAARGYRILCADTKFTNNADGYGGYEDHVPAIKAAVEYVRKISGVTKVVLVGHSMGAPMMAFYQNVAQNGPAACQKPERIQPCPSAGLANLPAADGLILLDPHLGDAVATMTYVDPAIGDEEAPAVRDKRLDMFDPSNGFDAAKSTASYSPAFRAAYLAAQAQRNARLIAAAQKRLAQIDKKDPSVYADDMPFVVPGANAARLFQPDLGLVRKTKRAHLLLKADGTTPTEVLVSVRVPSGKASDAMTFSGSAWSGTVKAFLAGHAVRTTPDYAMTEDDITGIDWDSANSSTSTNVKGVTVPLVIMTMTGHYFLRPSEIVLDAAASADKTLVGNEGASHGITPCGPCGTTPTQFGDTVKRAYDYLDGWLSKRF